MAYVTGWAAGVDGTKPEQVVRGTGHRVLTAARTVLAATDPETGRCRRDPEPAPLPAREPPRLA